MNKWLLLWELLSWESYASYLTFSVFFSSLCSKLGRNVLLIQTRVKFTFDFLGSRQQHHDAIFCPYLSFFHNCNYYIRIEACLLHLFHVREKGSCINVTLLPLLVLNLSSHNCGTLIFLIYIMWWKPIYPKFQQNQKSLIWIRILNLSLANTPSLSQIQHFDRSGM